MTKYGLILGNSYDISESDQSYYKVLMYTNYAVSISRLPKSILNSFKINDGFELKAIYDSNNISVIRYEILPITREQINDIIFKVRQHIDYDEEIKTELLQYKRNINLNKLDI